MLFYYLLGIFNINRAMSNLFKEVGLKEVGRFKYLTTSEFPEREYHFVAWFNGWVE